MTNQTCKVSVIGAGSWGSALAKHLAGVGHEVRLWALEPEVAQAINQENSNPVFLPGFTFPDNVTAFNDLATALQGAQAVVMVVPSHFFRQVLSQAAPHLPTEAAFVSCTKGIEADTGFTMCEVAEDVLPKDFHRSLCCLSGPSFAKEVAAGAPTAVTVASRSARKAQMVQKVFAAPMFRVYTSPDLVGVELGGAIKNPLAIAAGMVSGLGLGHNTLAALITRGLAEMTRLSQAKGGQLATLSGLAGLGDLVLTCTGDLSRNRTVGSRLGRGETIEAITSSTKMVAEGVINTKTVRALAGESGVEMPLTQAVYQVIYEGRKPLEVLRELMTRELKAEHD
ncbi:glycerol-3-phosphate dehydrogenase [Desulfocarbo indianensis]|nr:glycerol-3-phosphate dehydrogenase [Desulfocarbo indianensis]